MKYALPLHRRRQNAAYNQRRYWNDDEYRLHKINSARQRRGKPLLTSVEQIPERLA